MKNICVIGCGFVGAALSIVICNENKSSYVYALDQDTKEGKRRLNCLSKGFFPFEITDDKLIKTAKSTSESKRFSATYEPECISKSDVILITINIDLEISENGKKTISKKGFDNLVENLKKFAKPKSLIILMSTIPPGTTRWLDKLLNNDKKIEEKIYLAHSYERIMPGKNYYESIISQPRVLSAISKEGQVIAEEFLSTFSSSEIDLLSKPEESETSKLLENTYRAINIALIDEWTNFCSINDIDLNSILSLIRKRPTHKNIRSPGVGVGGYCLTKDLHFPAAAYDFIQDKSIIKSSKFPMANLAADINLNMPNHCLNFFLENISKKANIVFFGIAYRQDVGDTRFSPSLKLLNLLFENNFKNIKVFDPLVNDSLDFDGLKKVEIINNLKNINLNLRGNIFVFSVNHNYFSSEFFMNFIFDNSKLINKIIDLCNIPKYSELNKDFACLKLGTDF